MIRFEKNSHTGFVNVILCGGLGNQLFQYSVGRALSIRLNRKLRLNTSAFSFDEVYKRKFSLDAFSHPRGLDHSESRVQYKLNWFPYSLYLNKLLPSAVLNKFGIYDSLSPSSIRSIQNGYFGMNVVGYFQDEEYFSDYSDQIRRDLTPSRALSEPNEKLLSIIKDCNNSVSVHIRCNHEVSANSVEVDRELILSSSYYENALNYLTNLYGNLQLFIFTDNIDYVRKHFNFLNDYDSQFLSNDRGNDWEDLWLMSKCNANIIANSSFSWWGAWLGDDGKSIVAPRNMRYTPVCPSRWIIL